MCHVLKHASKRLHDPREVVAESLRCRKSGQFGGSSFRHVPLIAMVKEIVHPPDAFFRPFAQEQVKILIRPHSYHVEGNKVVHHIVTAWAPQRNGDDQVRYFEIAGRSLTIKTAPLKDVTTGRPAVPTLVFERIE